MNRQLNCFPPCNLSLFVSLPWSLSLTPSFIQTLPLPPSCSVNPSLAFCYFRTTETAVKNPSSNEGYEEITKRIKANSKRRTKDPSIIISLMYWSCYQPPVQRVPITAFCDWAQSRGLDTLHLPLPIALIVALSHAALCNQINHIWDVA